VSAALNFAKPAPYGLCAAGCGQPAIHRDNTKPNRLVCRSHLPEGVIWAPFIGKQETFMACMLRYVLFGGGAGPGKTDCALRKWISQWMGEHRRWMAGEIEASVGHCIIFRRQMPDLLQLIARFKRFYKLLDPDAEWNANSKTATFSCGYVVQFAGLENEDDWQKFYGNEYTLVIFDEATQFTIEQIEQIDSRIRTNPDVNPELAATLQLILCTNPVGHLTKLWLRERFVEAAEPEQPVLLRTKLRDGRTVEDWQIYIPANIYDNPAILVDGKYEANLMRKSAEARRALLDNDWYVDAGSWVGDDWDLTIHVCEPFPIPASWTKFKMGDYGFAANSSIQWAAVDFDDNMVIYRSLTIAGKTAKELGALIREIEREPLVINGVTITGPEWDPETDASTVWGPMDQSLWSRVGETGPSRGEILEQMGTGFFRADRSRESAAEQIRNRLRKRTPNANGELVIPGIRWFKTCKTRKKVGTKQTWTGPVVTIPSVPCDVANPDVWDTTADDHDLDSAGYGCLHRVQVPERETDEDDLSFARRKREVGAMSGFPGGR